MVFAFAELFLASTLAVTIAAAITRRPALARTCRALGVACLVWAGLATLSGVVATLAAVGVDGLGEADVARMRTNGVTEAAYNLLIGVAVGLPALLVGRRVLRAARK